MADKDIKIRLETEADVSGAKETKRSIDDLTDSVEGHIDALDDLEDELEEVEKASKKRTAAAAKEQREFEQAENVARIKRVQTAQVTAQLAGKVTEAGKAFRAAAKDVALYDEAQAEVLETTGEVMERTGRAASLIATGFATGGPAGAAVGGVVALFHELADSAAAAAEVAARAAAQVETDWKLSAEGVEAAKAATDEYSDAIKATNDARDESLRKIESEISLVQKLRAAELRRAGKKDAADIAEIEADPDLSAEEKAKRTTEIRARALARDQEARRKSEYEALAAAQREKKELEVRESAAASNLERAEKEAGEFSPAAAAKRKQKADVAAIVEQEQAAKLAGRLSGLDKFDVFDAIPGIDDPFQRATDLAVDGGNPEDVARAVVAAEAEARKLAGEGSIAEENINELIELANSVLRAASAGERFTADAEDFGRRAKVAEENLKKAREALDDATAARDTKDEGLDEEIANRKSELENQPEEFGDERRKFGFDADKKITAGRNRDEAKKTKAELDAAEARLGRSEGQFDAGTAGLARKASDLAGKANDGGVNKLLQEMITKLSNGTNSGELASLASQFEEVTRGMGGQNLEILRSMIAVQQQQSRALDEMRGQIKTMRDGR